MTIMEQILPQFMITFFEFLAKPLVDTNWIIIMPGWGLIHTGFGALFFYLVRKEKYPLLVVFLLLIFFEMFEYSISYLVPIILKEFWQDTLLDLILGMFGALIMYLILKKR